MTSPRIVALPGLGLDARSWAGVLRLLPAEVLTLPGMGRREPVPPLPTLVDEVVRRLGEGPVVLVGHSQACQVVAAVAELEVGEDRVVLGVSDTMGPHVLVGPSGQEEQRAGRPERTWRVTMQPDADGAWLIWDIAVASD